MRTQITGTRSGPCSYTINEILVENDSRRDQVHIPRFLSSWFGNATRRIGWSCCFLFEVNRRYRTVSWETHSHAFLFKDLPTIITALYYEIWSFAFIIDHFDSVTQES